MELMSRAIHVRRPGLGRFTTQRWRVFKTVNTLEVAVGDTLTREDILRYIGSYTDLVIEE